MCLSGSLVASYSYLYKCKRVDNVEVHVKAYLEVMLYLRLNATHSSLPAAQVVSVPVFKAKHACIQQACMHVYAYS